MMVFLMRQRSGETARMTDEKKESFDPRKRMDRSIVDNMEFVDFSD
jgi:hypothetical protein